MRRNIFFSLMIAFLFATTFSAVLSYCLSYYINMQSIIKDVYADEMNICHNFVEMHKTTDKSADTLTELFSNNMYIVEVMDGDSVNRISSDNILRLNNGEIIKSSEYMAFSAECLFKSGDNVVRVYLNPRSNIVQASGNRMGFILSMTLLFSAVIMFCAGKSMTKPIKQLSRATQKVAKGDFDVQVNVEGGTEVAQLADSFNKMVKELKSNELLKKDFISNVSHEFKTPLATVNGFAKLLKSGNCTTEEAAEYAGIIEHESARLSTLCGNILRLSRIENQKIVTKYTYFRLDEQIRDAILTLEADWSGKNIALDIDLEAVEFYGDEELLQHVWINIVGNAVKFSNDGGKVSVMLTESKKYVSVTVEDNGIGMDDETQKHIFEKFYQGDTSRSTLGNGLGLALVSEIVHLCGGEIKLSSKLGIGSSFMIILPKNADEDSERGKNAQYDDENL